MKVNVNPAAIERLANSREVADNLGEKAEKAAAGVNPPSYLTKYTRSGQGPQGAFAQIVVRGSGSIAWEWGSERQAPAGQLRAALHRVR